MNWHPTYYMLRPLRRERLPPGERPWFGYIRLVNEGGWAVATFEELWPQSMA